MTFSDPKTTSQALESFYWKTQTSVFFLLTQSWLFRNHFIAILVSLMQFSRVSFKMKQYVIWLDVCPYKGGSGLNLKQIEGGQGGHQWVEVCNPVANGLQNKRKSRKVFKPRKSLPKFKEKQPKITKTGKYNCIWKEKRKWQGAIDINTSNKTICSGEEKTWLSLMKKKLLIRTWNLCNRKTIIIDYVKAVLKEKRLDILFSMGIIWV